MYIHAIISLNLGGIPGPRKQRNELFQFFFFFSGGLHSPKNQLWNFTGIVGGGYPQSYQTHISSKKKTRKKRNVDPVGWLPRWFRRRFAMHLGNLHLDGLVLPFLLVNFGWGGSEIWRENQLRLVVSSEISWGISPFKGLQQGGLNWSWSSENNLQIGSTSAPTQDAKFPRRHQDDDWDLFFRQPRQPTNHNCHEQWHPGDSGTPDPSHTGLKNSQPTFSGRIPYNRLPPPWN